MKNAAWSFLPLALGLLFGGIGSACPARAQPPPTPGGVALQHPTDDGYEDLLNAVYAIPYRQYDAPQDDATAFRDLLRRAAHGDLPLADKRAILRDERVQDALGYLRVALDKPQLTRARSTREQEALDHRSIDARTLNCLKYVLSVKTYVEMADGATSSAIDTFAESLDLADAMGHWDFDGAEDGSDILPNTMNPLFLHIDRLSEGDCRRLLSFLKRELNMPNPAIAGLRADTKDDADQIDVYLQAKNLRGLAPGRELSSADEAAVMKLRAAGGADWADFVASLKATAAKNDNELADDLADYPQSLEAAHSAPPAEQSERDRLEYEVLRAASPGSVFVRENRLKAFVLQLFVQRNAHLQLLAVHAAIHQYKWNLNALPASLDALKLGTLANDPYVAGLMHYEPAKDGKSYELSCAGPIDQYDETGQPMRNGKRANVTLPYTDATAP